MKLRMKEIFLKGDGWGLGRERKCLRSLDFRFYSKIEERKLFSRAGIAGDRRGRMVSWESGNEDKR